MSRRRPSTALVVSLLVALAAPSVVQASSGPSEALDSRGWEMVSPVDKNGGDVALPADDGGVFQAAALGSGFAFGSATSFGEALGAAPANQYLASRGGSGWTTGNLTPPLLTGTYLAGPYQLFSADLSRAILSSGWGCRGGAPTCEEENPPLAAAAPAGYRNLYLREGPSYTPLITEADTGLFAAGPEEFEVSMEGASPDLHHVVFAADGGLYEWGDGALNTVSALPEAMLAAPAGAISADGGRVYFTQPEDGPLYLHEAGHADRLVPETIGGATFQVASTDGRFAFFISGSQLYRYDAVAEASEPIASEATGVLGASADASYVYFQSAAGLRLWHGGTTTNVASGAAAPSSFPPAIGTARVTADGTRLAFLSTASLTGYANVGKTEVFLYEAPTKHLLCASCNPRGTTPFGSSTIPGARAAGEGGISAYKPRALSADGRRLFFDSADHLLLSDSDGHPDVYEWEANGSGSCAKAAGCVALVSSGRSGEASFLDASGDGADVYFLTDASLLGADTGSVDVYDAREGGGFPEPPPAIPCEGDDCQGPPPGPDDPTPGTAALGYPSNPPLRWPKKICKRKGGPRHHSCGRKRHHSRHGHGKTTGRGR